MLKNLIFIVLLSFSNFTYGTSIKDWVTNAKTGDYFVAKYGKMTSLLRISCVSNHKIVLEEISAPSHLIKGNNWQHWIDKKAQGHTSWVMYEIDLDTNELIECFSFTRNTFLQPKDEHFLLTLMKCPLTLISNKNRKKIGSPPNNTNEPDFRAIWNPPKIINGKNIPHSKFLAFQTKWPEDHTELSGKIIHLYFDPNKEFFFPFWVEIISDHLTLPLKVIDAGHNLHSHITSIPRRPLQFLSSPKKTKQEIRFRILCPKYYQQIQLFAVNYSNKRKTIIEIPVEIHHRKGETLECVIVKENVSSLLKKNQLYSWMIKPKNFELTSELHEPFYYE